MKNLMFENQSLSFQVVIMIPGLWLLSEQKLGYGKKSAYLIRKIPSLNFERSIVNFSGEKILTIRKLRKKAVKNSIKNILTNIPTQKILRVLNFIHSWYNQPNYFLYLKQK